MERKCLICKETFTVPRYKPEAKFCSAPCRIIGNGRLSAKKRGDAQRGRGLGLSYRKLEGRHEHRIVAERMLGRSLVKGEVVHHINGNRLDNDPSNLVVITQSQHARIHSTKNRKCEVEGCQNKHLSLGFCNKHYKENRKNKNICSN